jgi:hypothetical protein
MSRCKACDVILTEVELKRKDRITGLHLDLCNTCLKHSDQAIEDDWVTFDGEDDIMLGVDDILRQEVIH